MLLITKLTHRKRPMSSKYFAKGANFLQNLVPLFLSRHLSQPLGE